MPACYSLSQAVLQSNEGQRDDAAADEEEDDQHVRALLGEAGEAVACDCEDSMVRTQRRNEKASGLQLRRHGE